MATSGLEILAMLLPLALNSEEGSEEANSSRIVKNTFIDVPSKTAAYESKDLRRRANSAPSLRRLLGSGSCVHSESGTPRSSSGGSTTFEHASAHSDCAASDTASLTTAVGRTRWCDMDSDDDEVPSTLMQGSASGTKLWSDEDSEEEGRISPRRALRSQAEAWVPAVTESIVKSLPPSVKVQFAVIVAAGLGTLKKMTAIQRTSVQETARGWSVAGHVASSDAGSTHFASTEAALLRAAEESSNVYVVGYEAEPFQSLTLCNGFKARLAFVENDQTVCWDLVSKGFCKRGCKCRWQHPVWQVDVDFGTISF